MTRITANLTKDVAMANTNLISNGMISIAPDENASTLPLDLVMVLDVSGSMSGTGIQVVIDSVLYIQSMMSTNDRLAIITFNNSAQVHSNWVGKNDTISALSAGGGTNFGAAINCLLDFLGKNGGDSSRAGIALFMSTVTAVKLLMIMLHQYNEFGYTMHCLGVTNGANP